MAKKARRLGSRSRARRQRPAPRTARSKAGPRAAGKRYVFFFGQGKADGDRSMRDVLGGKGAGLAEMTNAGLPVPPGFTISTAACTIYYEQKGKIPESIDREMLASLKKLETTAKATFGSPTNPLLVSVRSGAKFSMPGMMDTILNLGLNDVTVEGLKARTGNGRFAYDSYRRFIQMFGNVVLEIGKDEFEHELSAVKTAHHVAQDPDLDEAALREVVDRYKQVVKRHTKRDFPQDPPHAVASVPRCRVSLLAESPRQGIPAHLHDSGPHRDRGQRPDDGVRQHRGSLRYGRRLHPQSGHRGQGVLRRVPHQRPGRGRRGGHPHAAADSRPGVGHAAGIRPAAHDHLAPRAALPGTSRILEFTIQDDNLYMLQTRSGKRTGYAAVVIATDLVAEKVISPKDAVLMVEPEALSQLLSPIFDPKDWKGMEVATKGLPASPGAASGQVVFTADDAVEWTKRGKKVLLVRKETVPDDIHGMFVAQGILTATGGMTSHAAVVGRQMGKPSVVGAGALAIDERGKTVKVGTQTLKEGDWLSFDGLSGEVKVGAGGHQAERDHSGRQRRDRRARSRTSSAAST